MAAHMAPTPKTNVQSPAAAFALGIGAPASTYRQAVERVGDLLPHQGILENFVHHNPLEVLQSVPFSDALKSVLGLELYMSPGERVLELVDVDPRKRANEALVGVSAAFLDRGAAKWAPRFRDRGFMYFFANLEGLGLAMWRNHARSVANRILAANITADSAGDEVSAALAEEILVENADFFGVPPDERERALFATLLELPGWGGMFRRMEVHSDEAPPGARVRLLDFCAVQSVLARSSIEYAARHAGWHPSAGSFASWLSRAPTRASTRRIYDTVQSASAIAWVDQALEGREALETEVEYAMLDAIDRHTTVANVTTVVKGDAHARTTVELEQTAVIVSRPDMQLYTCIDDRECSLRRHLEDVHPTAETFGIAGETHAMQ